MIDMQVALALTYLYRFFIIAAGCCSLHFGYKLLARESETPLRRTGKPTDSTNFELSKEKVVFTTSAQGTVLCSFGMVVIGVCLLYPPRFESDVKRKPTQTTVVIPDPDTKK